MWYAFRPTVGNSQQSHEVLTPRSGGAPYIEVVKLIIDMYKVLCITLIWLIIPFFGHAQKLAQSRKWRMNSSSGISTLLLNNDTLWCMGNEIKNFTRYGPQGYELYKAHLYFESY
jgi:hypothetical protein